MEVVELTLTVVESPVSAFVTVIVLPALSIALIVPMAGLPPKPCALT
jgi:hypothetical protein